MPHFSFDELILKLYAFIQSDEKVERLCREGDEEYIVGYSRLNNWFKELIAFPFDIPFTGEDLI